MLGATNPADSAPGTIRGDFCIQVGRNICHGSDGNITETIWHDFFVFSWHFSFFTAVDSAAKEIALWFKDEELVKWDPVAETWVYE